MPHAPPSAPLRHPPPARFFHAVMAFFLAAAAGSAGVWAGFAVRVRGGTLACFGLLPFCAALFFLIRNKRYTRAAFDVLVLGVLMAWGIMVNHALTRSSCVADPCGDDYFRVLAEPEVFALAALHLVTVIAYAISRRRPEALHPPAELFVHAALVSGIVLHAFVAAQFGAVLLYGFLFPLTMPAFAPLLTIVLYANELGARLRRRGAEPVAVALPATSVYRAPDDPRLPTLPRQGARGLLVRAIATSPLLLGAYGVATGLAWREWGAAARVFTHTCGHTFSQIPIQPAVGQCHYLCTVAAQGHPGLVRPERFGVRRGQVILVNRQLAVANAFEDLLHARWPRFGGLARRVYDRLGWPVSRWIRRRWVADAVYLAMKPGEWIFYAALLLLDPSSPEERIRRMYT